MTITYQDNNGNIKKAEVLDRGWDSYYAISEGESKPIYIDARKVVSLEKGNDNLP